MSWRWVDLVYRNVLVDSFLGVQLDGARAFFVTPDMGFIDDLNLGEMGMQSYNYFLETELPYKLNELIRNAHKGIDDNEQQKIFNASVVTYKNQSERDFVEKNILNQFPNMKDYVQVTQKEIEHQTGIMTMEFNKDDWTLRPGNVEYMLRQLKITEFINQHKNEILKIF